MKLLFPLLLLGSFDPYNIANYSSQSAIILEHSHTPEEAIELHAIAFTESRFNPKAVSHTGDFGMFQINCNVWWSFFGYSSKNECKKEMMNPRTATLAAKKVLEVYRKNYRQCRKSFAYLCYNGGMGWIISKNKEKIKHYRRMILKRKRIFHHRHYDYFARVLNQSYDPHSKICLTLENQKFMTPTSAETSLSSAFASM